MHVVCRLQICDAGALVPDDVAEVLGRAAAQALAAAQDKGTPKLSTERMEELYRILRVRAGLLGVHR